MKTRVVLTSALLAGVLVFSQGALAQFGPPPKPAGPPPPAEKAAPIDLTGYWQSAVTEDWRWRMLTAPAGDFASVPLNAQGQKIAKEFDSAKYGPPASGNIDCRAYGAAGLMRMPTRVHITWANDNQLQLQSDWGEQTREIYFRRADMPQGPPSAQGSSFAVWQVPQIGGRGFGRRRTGPAPKPPTGKMYVVTNNLAPGWLRRNGVPYGAKTHMEEWYQTFHDPTGKAWFDVTTQVTDSEYLRAPFITSDDFRQEPNSSNWAPHPCTKG